VKLLWILCNESIAEEVKEVLDALPVSGCTVWQGILGTSLDGGTRWGDAVWPGKNWAFMVVDGEEKIRRLLASLGEMKKLTHVGKAGLKAFLQDAEEAI
jgi:PII-like signaling protein